MMKSYSNYFDPRCLGGKVSVDFLMQFPSVPIAIPSRWSNSIALHRLASTNYGTGTDDRRRTRDRLYSQGGSWGR